MAMERLPRLTLVNALNGYKSANLIGTTHPEHGHNLTIFSSVFHLGSAPPYFGFITRPTTVPRHTYSNIKEQGYYTLNHVHSGIYTQAHQTSAKYDQGVSEFEACGLTPFFSESFPAPYVAESHLKMGMQWEEEYAIKANGTIMVVGKLVELLLPAGSIKEDGFLALSALDTVAISGLDSYYQAILLDRLPYARPK